MKFSKGKAWFKRSLLKLITYSKVILLLLCIKHMQSSISATEASNISENIPEERYPDRIPFESDDLTISKPILSPPVMMPELTKEVIDEMIQEIFGYNITDPEKADITSFVTLSIPISSAGTLQSTNTEEQTTSTPSKVPGPTELTSTMKPSTTLFGQSSESVTSESIFITTSETTILKPTTPKPECPSLEDADRLSQTQLIERLTHPCRYDRLEHPKRKLRILQDLIYRRYKIMATLTLSSLQ